VNLEFSDDDLSLIDGFSRLVERAYPSTRFQGATSTPGDWTDVVGAGWAELGLALEEGKLELGTVVGLFQAAGRQLASEQLLTSAYLLPALACFISSASGREEILRSLRGRPGIIVGDGRTAVFPIATGQPAFGTEGQPNAYRLLFDEESRLTSLGLAIDATIAVRPTSGLSNNMGTVTVSGGAWHDMALDISFEDQRRIERTALLLHSSALLGCADEALQLTRNYALQRVQFKVPIASFQAVKHILADVAVALEVAWAAVLCAAADAGVDNEAALVARILSIEAGVSAARASAQVHGGIGFTQELNLHNYLKCLLEGSSRFGSVDSIAMELGKQTWAKHADAQR
jgi:hypothetical protein